MPAQKPTSIQDVLKTRQRDVFVGREEHLALFQRNLKLPPEDRRFIFNIWGQGGVGKSTLLRQFRMLAEQEIGALTALTDDIETDVPEAMEQLVIQLIEQGQALKRFTNRYRTYRQKLEELESDSEAPQGLAAFAGRTLTRFGMRWARGTLVGSAIFSMVNQDALLDILGQWAGYVTRKLGRKNAQLVLDPAKVLTPILIRALNRIAKKRPLVLCFDTYERTGPFLDEWLRDLLIGNYGDLPLNMLLVIAGRDKLDSNAWLDYEPLLARLSLEPFTPAETRGYLSRMGIIDTRVAELIEQLSSNLPLLVTTLAAESPPIPTDMSDPTDSAVERFLKWIEEPLQRQVAFNAALPRKLNQDILALLIKKDADSKALFAWLRERPFVEHQTDGWAYHDIVRTLILRHKRRISPRVWAGLHGRLAGYYKQLLADLELDAETRWHDSTSQAYMLEILYHRACQSPASYLPRALNGFLIALDIGRHDYASRWAATLQQAGKDTANAELTHWGAQLTDGLSAYEAHDFEGVATLFSALIAMKRIAAEQRAIAFGWRGEIYRLMARYSDSLADFDRAIALAPTWAWAIEQREVVRRQQSEAGDG